MHGMRTCCSAMTWKVLLKKSHLLRRWSLRHGRSIRRIHRWRKATRKEGLYCFINVMIERKTNKVLSQLLNTDNTFFVMVKSMIIDTIMIRCQFFDGMYCRNDESNAFEILKNRYTFFRMTRLFDEKNSDK